ncbi:hypothetical protein CEXT_411101 [Caerostris extrusa]|uniref:Uncharacterized protein n=1 Tax=Caerostris extrusa TaxID=172846 RepID=A0AAV4SQE5_CAEEX|nr:hypothetical protein CEXT_411101 [Caerostris extrusa]
MPLNEEAMPCKNLLSKEPQKRQEDIRSESSEDRQTKLETIGERRAKETEHQVQLSLERNHSCQTRQRNNVKENGNICGNGTKELNRL